MNIKKIFNSTILRKKNKYNSSNKSDNNNQQSIIYASTIARLTANFIDNIIVMLLRIIILQPIWQFIIMKMLSQAINEFKEKFGAEAIRTNDHFLFFLNHQFFTAIIIFMMIFILIGACYHAISNSSRWQATIGKKICKVIVCDINRQRISIYKAFGHYFLSLLPWLFPIYILFYQAIHHLPNIQETITSSLFNIIYGLLMLIWLQMQIFTRKKTSLNDMICKIIFIKKN